MKKRGSKISNRNKNPSIEFWQVIIIIIGLLLTVIVVVFNVGELLLSIPAPEKNNLRSNQYICTGNWNEYNGNPIIEFNDVHPFFLWNDPTIMKFRNGYRMWLSGGNMTKIVNSPFFCAIPINSDHPNCFIDVSIFEAISSDGITWEINPEPVLEPGSDPFSDWDGLRIETPSVIKVGNKYHLYYSGCDFDCQSTAIYSIGHATSNDGTNWIKDPNNPIINYTLNQSEWGFYTAAEPGAVYNPYDGKIYLYYVGFKQVQVNPDLEVGQIGILLATSDGSDGSNFEHYTDEIGERKAVITLSENYDPTLYRGYSTPYAFIDSNGNFQLFYDVVHTLEGFEQIAISRAVSNDGLEFNEIETDIIKTTQGAWNQDHTLAPSIIEENGMLRLWFSGGSDEPFGWGIGYAACNLPNSGI